jgi:hypothetical protein
LGKEHADLIMCALVTFEVPRSAFVN